MNCNNMAMRTLYVNDVENHRTSLRVIDKRTGTGHRWINLGKVSIDEINGAIKKHPKTDMVFIAGWMFSVDGYKEFLERGSAEW